jgi:hypothetical protein
MTAQPFSALSRATWSSKSGRSPPMSGTMTSPKSLSPAGGWTSSAGVPEGSVILAMG